MVIHNTIDEFKRDFDEIITGLEYMGEMDKMRWKAFSTKIGGVIEALYNINRNDVRGIDNKIGKIQTACKIFHNQDEDIVHSSSFDKHADKYVEKKLRFVSGLIIGLFVMVLTFGSVIWGTSLKSIDSLRTDVSELRMIVIKSIGSK